MVLNKDLSFDSVMAGFKAVSGKTDFSKKIEAAKKNNQQIFFKIGSEYYLINNGGWLKLTSPEELISIDGKQTIKVPK